MATNCCSAETCSGIVTLGYMIDMAVSDCGGVVTSGASAFSSCCSAETSAYTPTYGELISEKYAPIRVLNNQDPSQDVNGFTVSKQILDSGHCCVDSVDEKRIPKSDLEYGYTVLDGIELINSAETSNKCEQKWDVFKRNLCTRYNRSCSGDGITTSATSVSSNELKVFSGITLSKIYSYEGDGVFNVSWNQVTITASTSDSCGNTESGSTTVSANGYTILASIECPTEPIPCEGGDIIFTISGEEAECDIVSVSAKVDGIDVETSGNKIKIPKNDNGVTSSTLVLTINISNEADASESGELACENFSRMTCGVSPITPSSPCGMFPCEDVWGNDVTVYEA